MRHDCDICGGSGVIILPTRRPVALSIREGAAARPIRDTSRIYACPECSDDTPITRCAVIEADATYDATLFDRLRNDGRRQMARGFAHKILAQGLMVINKPVRDDLRHTITETAVLGIVSPYKVKTFEERLKERQDDRAVQLAGRITAEIVNWGSAYGDRGVSKATAARLITSTLHEFSHIERRGGV